MTGRAFTFGRFLLRDLARRRAFAAFFAANLALGLAGALLLDALQGSIDRTLAARSRSMLGADLRVTFPYVPAPEELAATDAVAGASRATDLLQTYSMATGAARARLVEVRGVAPGFPLSGEVVLERGGRVGDDMLVALDRDGVAWADPAVLSQLGASIGDTIRLGSITLRLADTVIRDAGLGIRAASLAPRLYIGASKAFEAGLVQTGSRLEFQHLVALPDGADADEAAAALRARTRDARVRVTSHGEAAAEVSGAYERVTRYLGLVAMCALALSSVSCGYLFHAFLQRRLADLAILQSLGARRGRATSMLVGQVLLLGALAAGGAVALAWASLPALSSAFAAILPAGLELAVGWREALATLVVALVVGPVSCLALLARLRTLRVADLFQEEAALALARSRLAPLAHGAGVALFLALAAWKAGSLREGAAFVGVLAVAFALLAGAGRLLLPAIATIGERGSTAVRLALRGLDPRRRGSTTGFVALALAALLLALPPQLRALLASQLQPPDESAIPSLFLFDIQPEQAAPLAQAVESAGTRLQRLSPMVRARLQAVNGRAIDTSTPAEPGAGPRDASRLRARTYNLTWQEALHSTERIVEGRPFSGRRDPADEGPAEVSVEEDFAGRLGVALGDVLRFDVQGVPVEGRIVSLRAVEWTSMQPNFFVTFQPGVLEEAPAVYLASVPSLPRERREALAASLVERFPNVSMIDVTRGVERALSLLTQLEWAVSATAWATLAVGLALVFAIARDEAERRRRDFQLLKVLGARHALLRAGVTIEFAVLGSAAASVGVLLGAGASAALAAAVLDTSAAAASAWTSLLGIVVALPAFTAATARIAMRRALAEKPSLTLR